MKDPRACWQSTTKSPKYQHCCEAAFYAEAGDKGHLHRTTRSVAPPEPLLRTLPDLLLAASGHRRMVACALALTIDLLPPFDPILCRYLTIDGSVPSRSLGKRRSLFRATHDISLAMNNWVDRH